MSLLLLVGQTAPLAANPTGGAVVAGSATIGSAGATLSINQSTQNAIINWQQFSIAGGETTKFIVPNSGATLNRVIGGNPSAIYGNLQSNGTLYLVNPSGIVVGPSGRIDTAGFLASTLDISNQQFLAGGNLEFAGSSGASLENDGLIHASTGDVYLIADQVNNKGTLSAPQGTVGLAAGSDVLFQQAGTQHLFIQATPAGTKRATGATNSGTIRAAAAELKAAGGNAYALAINNTGVIAATGYKRLNGDVYLISDGGSIANGGTISAQQANGNGGTIVVDGTAVSSPVSGTVTNSGTLSASATVAGGKGGTVTLKNMGGKTVHSGKIVAKGGQGGAGGNAEVSAATVQFTGTVDLTAPGGLTGNLLLDPTTFTVAATGGDETGAAVSATLQTANLTLNADDSVTIDDGITWTSGTTLTLSTNTGASSSIAINAPISGVNGGLTISAAGSDPITTGASGSVDVANFILQSGTWSQIVGQNGLAALPAFTASNNFELQGSSTFERFAGIDSANGNADEIADIYGLQGLASTSGNLLSANAELVNNIDASGTATWNNGAGFVPIGRFGANFTGTLNGQNDTINGLYINTPGANNVGLFGYTGSGSTIENVGLTNVQVSGSGEVGGLVGNSSSTITNAFTTGTVNTGASNSVVGGLVGGSSGAIGNAYSTAAVIAGNGSFYIGGLVGANNSSITDAYSAGTITTGTSTSSVGGLVGGNNSSSTISSSYSTADVTAGNGSFYIGGLVGANNTSITEAYSTGAVIAGSSSSSVGGLVGGNNGTGTISNASSTGTVIAGNTSFNIGGLVGTNNSSITGVYSTGSVVAGAQSSTIGGLVGGNNSDATISNASSRGSVTAGSGSFNIGGLVGHNDFAISDASSTAYVIAIGSSNVGGLVGLNDTGSSIANAYGTGSVTTGGQSSDVGGLVGANLSTITDSYSTGSVNAAGFGAFDVGGLVGFNESGATVTTSYSSAMVSGGVESLNVGGLAGTNDGTMSNVYSLGAVTAGADSFYTGGLVGQNTGAITDAYSTGSVSGSAEVGGLVGYNAGSISNGFWDTTTSGSTYGVGGLNGASVLTNVFGLTTPDLLSASTYVGTNTSSAGTVFTVNSDGSSNMASAGTSLSFANGWNIGTDPTSNIWVSFNGQTRPMLAMEYSLTITNAHQLQLIGLNSTTLGASYTLANNIDLSGVTNASEVWGTSSGEGGNGGAGFVPIGNSTTNFIGKFNGQGYSINDLYINTPSATNVGLFGESGYNYNGEFVENVGVTNVQINGLDDVGGLVGNNNEGTITNAYSTGSVNAGSGASNVGGLVGSDAIGSISNCSSSSAVTVGSNSSAVGGLEGGSDGGAISDSYSTGAVTAGSNSSDVGGLEGAGANYSTIGNSYSTGAVSAGAGSTDVGGLVGNNGSFNPETITASYSTGAVSGTTNVGGLVGYDGSGSTISNSYSTGAVSGTTGVGGLVGQSFFTIISNDYSTGTVTGGVGSQYVGGLMGENAGAGISNAYSTGSVTVGINSSDVGGLVGENVNSYQAATVSNAYSTGLVTVGSGSTDVGGLVGYNGSGCTVSTSYSTSAVSGSGSNGVGGLVGYNAGTAETSYAAGTVSGNDFVGGLVGNNYGSVESCYAIGAVSGSSLVGGLVGYNDASVVMSYATGAVSGSSDTGGLVGDNDSAGTINTSFWDTGTTGTNIGVGLDFEGTATSVFGLTSADLLSESTYLGTNTLSAGAVVTVNSDGSSNAPTGAGTNISFSSGGWDFGTGGTDLSHTWVSFDGQTRPMLSMEYGTTITNAHQVQLIGLNPTTLSANYTLANDINLSVVTNASDIWGTTINGGGGFVPNGYKNAEGGFTGTFNGQGHTVNDLYIKTPGNGQVALFSYSGGTVENVGLTNVSISGNFDVGAVVGFNAGTISNAYSTGTVLAESDGSYNAGGLAGENDGTINNAYSTATVNAGGSNYVGGLVGENLAGTISNCYTAGSVSGFSDVGGLVGLNESTISNSYNSGSVTAGAGAADVGGLVGFNNGGGIVSVYSTGTVTAGNASGSLGGLVGENNGGISNAYSTGNVVATGGASDVGGLVGISDAGAISNVYSTGSVSGTSTIGGLVGEIDAGSISNAYSTGAVESDASFAGGLVGINQSGTTISNSFWATDTAGVGQGVGNGSSTGVTGATTSQLMTQSFFPSSYDFTHVWSTNGDTTTPQLIVQPITLTGTAFTDSGETFSPNVGVNLISGGSVLDSNYADRSGNFFFITSSSNLIAGSLLTNAANNGTIYYQADIPSNTINLELYGSTLKVLADTASNSALGQAAGSLSGVGINYAVSGANLTTSSGVNMIITDGFVPDGIPFNYTLDGNITVGGNLSTNSDAVLTGSKNVTLTAASVSLAGTINRTGSLAITTTSGEIDFNNIGTSSVPATAAGITLNSAGAVSLNNSYITTNGGDFLASGNGYTSLNDNNGNLTGVDIESSTINARGGNIGLIGNAGYDVIPNGALAGGIGVLVAGGSVLETTGAGNITIDATYNQSISVSQQITAFDMYSSGNSISAVSGTISIIGNVVQGQADGQYGGGANVIGVEIGGGATLAATGTGGSISLTGYAPAADSIVSGSNLSFSDGIEVGGNGESSILSIGSAGSITLNGAGGMVDTSNSGITGSDIPFTAGVIIDNGANLSTSVDSTLSITGTGGTILSTGTFTGNSEGVTLVGNNESLFMDIGSSLNITGFGGAVNAGFDPNGDGNSTGVELGGSSGTSIITLADGGEINITGTGGYIDTSNAGAVGDSIPGSTGVNLQTGTDIVAEGSTSVTITGTGGTDYAGEGQVGSAPGVIIGTDQSGQSTLVTSQTGSIQITGTGGPTPSLGTGVTIYGFDGGAAMVESFDGGSITLTGSGGSGYFGPGSISGNSIPNTGVAIVDNAAITTDGSVSVTGTGGSNSLGVSIQELTSDPTLDSDPVLPTISAGGAFTATALSGTGILVNASVSAASVALGTETNLGDPTSITSGPLTIQDATITTTGGDVIAYGSGYVSSSDANGSPDGIDVFSSTINANGGNISLTGLAGYVYTNSFGPDGGLLAGNGVVIGTTDADTLIETVGAGSLTIQGIYSQDITTYGSVRGMNTGLGINGVAIFGGASGAGTTLSVDQGSIDITGTVSQGTSGDGTSQQLAAGGIDGVLLAGALVEATGDGGSISITGNTSGSTVYDSSNGNNTGNNGLVIAGNNSPNTTISVTTDGSITLTGTAGTVDSTYAPGFDSTGSATGLSIATATQITGGGGSTIALTGTGGSGITNDGGAFEFGTSYTGSAEGIDIGDDNSQGGIAQITVGNGGSIGITGYGGSMDISNDVAPDYGQNPDVQGVHTKDSTITANGSATITFMGTGGTVTAGSNTFGGATGVAFDGHNGTNLVSSQSGQITITGFGGASPSQGAGVTIAGFNGATTEIESTAGNISITGTGGDGYNGSGAIVANYIPSIGIAIVDAATLMTGGTGTISLTGTGGGNGLGGSNSNGVEIVEINDSTIDASPVPPTITAGGAFTANALSSTGINVDGNITAASATLGAGTTGNFASITSGPLVVQNASFTLTGGNFNAFGKGGGLDADGMDIEGSTINTGTGSINLTGQNGVFVYEGSEVPALDGLNIAGEGVLIDTSTLSTTDPGNITVFGDASIGSTTVQNALIGLEVASSSLTVQDGLISLKGTVNSGTALANALSQSAGFSGDGVQGLQIGQDFDSAASVISATGAAGAITLIGDVSGSTSDAIDNTVSTHDSDGVSLEKSGTTISSAGNGVAFVNADITYNGIYIQATAGNLINNSNGASGSSNANGLDINGGVLVQGTGAASITLVGQGGSNSTSPSGTVTGATTGVNLKSDASNPSPDNGNTQVTTQSGEISIIGTGGTSPNKGVGVLINGKSGATTTVSSNTGNIIINGAGGPGNTTGATSIGTGSGNGELPNDGVAILGDSVLQTDGAGASISITGTGQGTNGAAILVAQGGQTLAPALTASGTLSLTTLFSGVGDILTLADSTSPVAANFTGSSVTLDTQGNGNVSIDGPITASTFTSFLIQAPVITLDAAITSSQGNIVLVDGTQFVNTAGSAALSAAGGYAWQVWSVNPPGSGQSTVDTVDGLTPDFIQYGATYGVTTAAVTGNGLLYSYTPSALDVVLNAIPAKTYDGTENLTIAANSYTATSSELVGGDSISAADALTGTLNSPDVGIASTVTVDSAQLSSTATQGGVPVYGYTIVAVSGTATVVPAPLTVTANPVTKTYDGTDSASGTATVTSGTLYTNVGTGVQDSVSGGILAFTNPNAGTGDKTVTVSGATISDGNGGGNYNVTYVANTTSTINPASLTISTINVVRNYNGTDLAGGIPIATSGTLYTNVGTGVQDSLSGGTYAYTDPNVGAGNKTVTVTGVTVNDGNNGGNYTVAYVNNTTSTINPALLTLSTTPVTKTYDGGDSALGTVTIASGTLYTNASSGLQDTLSGGTFAFTDPNAGIGDKTVTVGGVTVNDGNGGANYDVTYLANTTSTISQAPLTVSLTGTVTKVYDGTTFATPISSNYNLGGVIGGDMVGVTQTTANYNTPNVGGEETVTVGGLSLTGPGAGNYQLGTGTLSAGIGAITPATLSYVADPVTITIGMPLPETYSGTVTGFAPGDNLSNATSGTLIFATMATSSNPVGNYAIDGSGLTANNGNYTFVQADSNASALAIVNPSMNTGTTTTISTTTGGAAGGGSNLVPPVLTPQLPEPTQTTGNTSSGNEGPVTSTTQPPPFNFTGGTGGENIQTALPPNPLAESSGNGGSVGSGDVAQLNDGQLNNVVNPKPAGMLNEALGPIVYQNLADALKDLGDWADVPDSSGGQAAGSGETILTGGDVAEMTGNGVKNIPLNQAPVQLQNALGGDVLKGMGAGH